MSKVGIVITTCLASLILCVAVFLCTPYGRGAINQYNYTMQKTDDATLYETRKTVEDTCRAMQASYKADCLTYQQYSKSDDKEKQNWAEQAKMRANRTATTYNEYVLKNDYVWNGNVPADIEYSLNYLE